MEDICIGRKTRVRVTNIALAATDVTVVGANADRIGVAIGMATPDSFVINFGHTAAPTDGLHMNSTLVGRVLTVEEYGSAVSQEIHVARPAGADNGSVLEVILEKECES